MSNVRRSEGEPHNRLTRIADRVGDLVAADPEFVDGDRCIVFVDDDENGGLGLFGYENDVDAIAAMLTHLKALFEANGKTLAIVPFEGGQG